MLSKIERKGMESAPDSIPHSISKDDYKIFESDPDAHHLYPYHKEYKA